MQKKWNFNFQRMYSLLSLSRTPQNSRTSPLLPFNLETHWERRVFLLVLPLPCTPCFLITPVLFWSHSLHTHALKSLLMP